MFISRANVSIGFLLFFISLNALTKGGILGEYLFKVLSDLVTGIGANLVYTAGIFVGLVVFFDTSIDELFGILKDDKDSVEAFEKSYKDRKKLKLRDFRF